MDKLVIIFPLALALFILLWFLGCGRALGRPETPLTPPRRGRDALCAGAITLVYAVIAFWNLGDMKAPVSWCLFQDYGNYADFELPQQTQIGRVMYYSANGTGSYYMQVSDDGESWTDVTTLAQDYAGIYKWHDCVFLDGDVSAKYVRLIADGELRLGELAVYDKNGALLDASTFTYQAGVNPIFDEQQLIPDSPGYMNSSYFDEVYHARTAWENITHVSPYENTHPPLGKLLISVGIRLFGMTPFGWRFMGTLFGVLMLPILYFFQKKLFRSTAAASCGTLVFAFDFMHFVQTRIATIDTYAVFFILLMYLFMYLFITERRRNALYLALSGVSFGVGCACKWTVVYAGAGLGVIWLLYWLLRWLDLKKSRREALSAREGEAAPPPPPAEPHGGGLGGIPLKGEDILHVFAAADTENVKRPDRPEKKPASVPSLAPFRRALVKNILWCLLFFVAAPVLIYYVSYWPYGRAEGLSGLGMYFTRDYARIVLNNQLSMFDYHSTLVATHPYSSNWYQWMLDARPILYYLDYLDGGAKSTFGAFASPLLCWAGLVAVAYLAWLAAAKRDRQALFLLIGYLAQLLPWVLVPRLTFAYHYFPCTLFLTLALGRVFSDVRRRESHWRRYVYGLTAVSAALFAAFYPILSGAPVSQGYAAHVLRWFGSWPF